LHDAAPALTGPRLPVRFPQIEQASEFINHKFVSQLQGVDGVEHKVPTRSFSNQPEPCCSVDEQIRRELFMQPTAARCRSHQAGRRM